MHTVHQVISTVSFFAAVVKHEKLLVISTSVCTPGNESYTTQNCTRDEVLHTI